MPNESNFQSLNQGMGLAGYSFVIMLQKSQEEALEEPAALHICRTLKGETLCKLTEGGK